MHKCTYKTGDENETYDTGNNDEDEIKDISDD